VRPACLWIVPALIAPIVGCQPKAESPPAAAPTADAGPKAPPAAPGVGRSAPEKAAVAAANAWLKLVDEGKYQESWQETAGFFRAAVPQTDWTKQMKAVRAPLGALQGRTAQATQYLTSLPGAPDGEYVVVIYRASYEKKGTATETVTPMREADGSWRVSGYFVK